MLKHSIPFPLIQKIKIICHYFVVKNFHLPNSEILVTPLRVFCGVYVCVWVWLFLAVLNDSCKDALWAYAYTKAINSISCPALHSHLRSRYNYVFCRINNCQNFVLTDACHIITNVVYVLSFEEFHQSSQ